MIIRIYGLTRLLLGFFLIIFNFSFAQLGLYGALQVASADVIALQDQPLYFFNGVIGSEGDDAQLLFLGSAQALNASQDAYSEIEVSITASELNQAFLDLLKQSKSIEISTRIITEIYHSAAILASNPEMYKLDKLKVANRGILEPMKNTAIESHI